MKVLRYLTLFMLLHHEPGVCAPALPTEEKPDPEQIERLRQALHGQDVRTMTPHQQSVYELMSAPVGSSSRSMGWATREAIEAARTPASHFRDKIIKSLEQKK